MLGGGAAVLTPGFPTANVVQIGGRENHREVALHGFADPLGVPRHPAGMADALEVVLEIALHLDRHPVLQQVFLLGRKPFRQRAQALLGIRAVGGAAEVHLRVDEAVAAFAALAGGVVLEKFNGLAALGTFFLENRPWLPVLHVLSRAPHIYSPSMTSHDCSGV